MAIGEPKTVRGAATRARLICAARDELIERRGVLEIDSVAERADVSVGAIYRHYESRAGLIESVIDDFYTRYRIDSLEIDPAPDADFADREHRRTELMVSFNYRDPLARVILSYRHLDAEVAIHEAHHVDEMIATYARRMSLAQRHGEIPRDRDPRFVGAMIIGGTRRVLCQVLNGDPRVSERTTARKLWVLNAALMGIDF